MTARRGFVCLCLDITEKDIAHAVAHGFVDPELLKRYTACFMGPCQGKACMDTVLETLAEQSGQELSDLRRPTVRPPVQPITLAVLGADEATDA